MLSEENKFYSLSYGVDMQRRKSVYSVNGVVQQTRYYLGNYEEEILPNGDVRQIHYIAGTTGLSAIYIFSPNNPNLTKNLYAYTDMLGSVILLTTQNHQVVEKYAYDPWGKRRNPNNWSENDNRTSWLINRGFTGHEHLDPFGIINMNGRVYDPLTAMFFSPDPFVQSPDNWLNFNRYGYCYNNPFRYTDPSGEFILTAFTFIIDFFYTLFNGGLNGNKETRDAAWARFDPTNTSSKTNQAWQIDIGLFQTDPNKTLGDQVWQFVSRFTFELLQTFAGSLFTHAMNIAGQIDRVDYFGGATFATKENASGRQGVSIGNYIWISNDKEINGSFSDYIITHPMYMHEYGHYIDSQNHGPAYLFAVGIPSLISASQSNNHNWQPYERRANTLASDYFYKYYDINWISPYLTLYFNTPEKYPLLDK